MIDGSIRSGLFVAEGSSDMPLANLVGSLFLNRGVSLALSRPDFSSIARVPEDVASRLTAGGRLLPDTPDVVVVHRDADNAGHDWLLLDEAAIRFVAGNPRGCDRLPLPRMHEVEGVANPKELLQRCLLSAASVSGRRRQQFAARFSQNRRQLIERLDPDGPVTRLDGWQKMVASINTVVDSWSDAPDSVT